MNDATSKHKSIDGSLSRMQNDVSMDGGISGRRLNSHIYNTVNDNAGHSKLAMKPQDT